mgnify:CR=1 FL=1
MILKEELVEDLISKTLEELGYEKYNTHFNKDNLTNVIDFEELKQSLIKINKNLEIEYIESALEKIKKLSIAVFGTFLFAAGMNLFVVSANLYSGGFLGIGQIIRTFLIDIIGYK